MVVIDAGRRLRMVDAGPAAGPGPAVLLEAGSFGFSADWAALQPALAEAGLRSLAYDRAGLGCSDPGPAPRDGLAIAADLEALLEVIGESGPFILCGHSMGGLHVHLFAARNRQRVAGLVLVDAATPQSMESRRVSAAVTQFGHATRLAAWGAEAGFFGLLAALPISDAIGLRGEARVEKQRAFASGSHNRASAQEAGEWAAIADQARRAGDLDPRWPVAVVLAGPAGERAWLKTLLAAPAHHSHQGHVEHVEGADHASVLGPQYAEAIVRAVEWVVAAGKGGAS